MHSRPRSTAQILIATVLGTAAWEVLVAVYVYPHLCIGGCWRLVLFYAAPVLILPAFASWRLEPVAGGTPVPFLMVIASASAEYLTLMGLSIVEEMPLGPSALEWFVRVALIVALPVVVTPMIVAIVIVAVIGGLRARRNPVQQEEPAPGTESRPSPC